MGLNLTRKYSINFSLPKRSKKQIKFLIIHYTGMINEAKAIKRLCDPKAKVSSHYFISNKGSILSLVPDLYEAWHAGDSRWKNYKSINKYSIGIEINNPGHEHGYKKFPKKQIFSLIRLLKYLKKRYYIKKTNILGHSDISPNRKKDPGEKFPWHFLAKKNLSIWHKFNEKKIKSFRNISLKDNEKRIFFVNLHKIGYSKVNRTKKKLEYSNLIKAFQRKFRQDLVNGKVDKECYLISKSIQNKR